MIEENVESIANNEFCPIRVKLSTILNVIKFLKVFWKLTTEVMIWLVECFFKKSWNACSLNVNKLIYLH